MRSPHDPIRFIASRSAVMPSLVVVPSSQCHQVNGLAESGEERNSFSNATGSALQMALKDHVRLEDVGDTQALADCRNFDHVRLWHGIFSRGDRSQPGQRRQQQGAQKDGELHSDFRVCRCLCVLMIHFEKSISRLKGVIFIIIAGGSRPIPETSERPVRAGRRTKEGTGH
jgi:hypothetical protein